MFPELLALLSQQEFYWQCFKTAIKLDDDRQITAELVLNMIPKELAEFQGSSRLGKDVSGRRLIYFAFHRRGV